MSGSSISGRTAQTFLGVTLSALMVLSILPTAAASLGSYGTIVGASTTEQDNTGLLLLTPAASLRFNDADGSGNYNCPTSSSCDPIYLHFGGSASVASGDVRLFHPSQTEGEQVETTDDDFGNPLSSLGGSLVFVDVYPTAACPNNHPPCDGVYNAGEPLFVDADGSGTITSVDIELFSESSTQNSTGSSRYQKVSSTFSRLGNNTVGLGATVSAFDANGDGSFSVGDGVFLDVDGDGAAEPGDIQLVGPENTRRSEILEVSDDLTVKTLNGLGAARLAWNDADGDGIVDDSEEAYIDIDGAGPVARFDIEIAPVSGSSSTSSGAGEQIDAGDSELTGGGVSLTGIPNGNVKYRDNNGNGVVDSEDDVYIDINNANNQIEAGDIVLARGGTTTGTSSPGDRVDSGSSQIGRPLTTPGAFPGFTFVDFNGGGYGINDALYLDWDGNGVVSPGDVRVSKGDSPMTTFGEFIDDSNQDANFCYRFTFGAADTAWLDSGTPGTVNLDEAVYLDRAGSGTSLALDIRVTTGAQKAAGTFVETGDTDHNKGLSSLGGLPFLFHDSNGDGSWSLGTGTNDDDGAYIDVSGGGSINVGDGRLTKSSIVSQSPGSKVRSGEQDVSLPLATLPAGFTIRGLDRDGDGTFGLDDELYVNVDAAREGGFNCPTPGDIRLSGSGGASSSTTTTGGGGGGGTGGTGTTQTPPSVTISQPSAGAVLDVGQQVTISGSASGGSDSLAEVTVSVGGTDIGTSSSSTWSFTWTPQTEGQHTITATVADNTGETQSFSRTVAVGQDSDGDGVFDSDDDCPDQAGDRADGCPEEVRDEQARQDAQEANQTAQEAKQAAEEASETAREAKQAAEAARDTAQNTSKTIDQLIEQANQTGGNGAPGPGALGVLLATLVAGTIAGVARRDR